MHERDSAENNVITESALGRQNKENAKEHPERYGENEILALYSQKITGSVN